MTLVLNGTTGVSGVDGSAGTPAVQGNDTNTGVFFPAADTVAVATGGSERVRVDSSGNVGVGVTPGTWSPGKAIEVGTVGNGVFGTGANDMLITSGAYYNSGWKYAVANSLGASAYEQYNSQHRWYVVTPTAHSAGDAISFTQAMTLDSSGNLLVGTTSGLGGRLCVQAGNDAITTRTTASVGSTQATAIGFQNGSGSFSGAIYVSGTTTQYATSSDYRLKEQVQPLVGALAKVSRLKPCTYKWKADGSDGEGFIAHELAEVCPGAVSGEKDAVDAEGNIVPQGIDTSFLVATLTAAIQELNAKVAALEAKLGAQA